MQKCYSHFIKHNKQYQPMFRYQQIHPETMTPTVTSMEDLELFATRCHEYFSAVLQLTQPQPPQPPLFSTTAASARMRARFTKMQSDLLLFIKASRRLRTTGACFFAGSDKMSVDESLIFERVLVLYLTFRGICARRQLAHDQHRSLPPPPPPCPETTTAPTATNTAEGEDSCPQVPDYLQFLRIAEQIFFDTTSTTTASDSNADSSSGGDDDDDVDDANSVNTTVSEDFNCRKRKLNDDNDDDDHHHYHHFKSQKPHFSSSSSTSTSTSSSLAIVPHQSRVVSLLPGERGRERWEAAWETILLTVLTGIVTFSALFMYAVALVFSVTALVRVLLLQAPAATSAAAANALSCILIL